MPPISLVNPRDLGQPALVLARTPAGKAILPWISANAARRASPAQAAPSRERTARPGASPGRGFRRRLISQGRRGVTSCSSGCAPRAGEACFHGGERRHARPIGRRRGRAGWKGHAREQKLCSVRGLTMGARSVESHVSMSEERCTRPHASGRAARGSGDRRAGGAAENLSHGPSRESPGRRRPRSGAAGNEGRNSR